MAQTKAKTNTIEKKALKAAKTQSRVRRTSYYYFSRCAFIWHYIRLSLPLDLIAFGLGMRMALRSPIELGLFELSFGLTILSITIIIGLGGPSELYLKLRKLQNSFSKLADPRLVPALAIILALIPLSEVAIRLINIQSALVGLFFGTMIAFSIRYALKHTQSIEKHLIKFEREPIRWIEHQNKLVFAFNLIPLLLIRFFSISCALYLGSIALPIWQSILLIGSAWLLVISLRPMRESFMANCPRCLMLTSIVIREIGSCPACDRNKYFPKSEQKLVKEYPQR